jgi:hypothetical protein
MEQEIREIIRRELPRLITEDPELHNWVWTIVHEHSFSRAETESRFDKVLDEIRQSREELRRYMEESERRWQASERRWKESERRWQENERRWKENERRWEESERRWEQNQQQIRELIKELQRQGEELQRQGKEIQRQGEELQRQVKEIQRVDRRIDQTIGALGARWGMMSEETFRNALRGILEENFGVKVERVQYKDESGEVFGRPDQVELDVVIYDDQMLVCEIKSSASRADVYTFERKVRSYEKRVGRKANRAILISPMIEDAELAHTLGIEVYTRAEDVRPTE